MAKYLALIVPTLILLSIAIRLIWQELKHGDIKDDYWKDLIARDKRINSRLYAFFKGVLSVIVWFG